MSNTVVPITTVGSLAERGIAKSAQAAQNAWHGLTDHKDAGPKSQTSDTWREYLPTPTNLKNALDEHPNAEQDKRTFQTLGKVKANPYFEEQKNAQSAQARNLKDPSEAPTPGLKLAAVAGKLDRIYNSPEYMSLQPENKVKIKGVLYDKYIAPVFKLNGVEPPAKDYWLAGKADPAAINAGEHKSSSGMLGSFTSGFLPAAAENYKMLANILHGIGSYATTDKGKDTKGYKALNQVTEKVTNYADKVSNIGTSYQSNFDTERWSPEWFANYAGKLIGGAPAYMAAGEILGPAYKAMGLAPEAGAMAKTLVPSLAERAAKSAGFKLVTAGLRTAGDVFAVDKADNRSTKEAAGDAAGAAILTPAFPLAGKILGKIFGPIGEKALRFKAFQYATGGAPAVNTFTSMADEMDGQGDKSVPEGGQKSIIKANDPDAQQVANNELWLREAVARQFHPEKADEAGAKSVWRNLSKGQRAKIIAHIDAIGKASTELMPIVAPEISTQANGLELTQAAVKDPEFAKIMQSVEKLTGLKVADAVTKAQAQEVAEKYKLDSPQEKLKAGQEPEAESEHVEYEPKEGSSASLRPNYTVNFKNAKSILTAALVKPKLPVEDFINGTIKYLEDTPATKSGKVYYEHPEHHLLAIAYNTDVPDSVARRARNILRSDFGENKVEQEARAKALKYHVTKVKASGRLESQGNIFRSTRLTGPRYNTKWAKELVPEVIAQENKKTDRLLKQVDPKTAAAFRQLNKGLNILADKSATGAKALARKEALLKMQEEAKRIK